MFLVFQKFVMSILVSVDEERKVILTILSESRRGW